MNNANDNQNIGKREREVVHLLMQGKGNNQIAHELGVSVRTVEYHLGRVYAKLNVASRAEAILKLANAETWEPANPDHDLPEDSLVAEAVQTASQEGEAVAPPTLPERNFTDEGWGSRLWIIATIVLAILITGLISAGILIPAMGWVEPQVATVIVTQVIPQTQIVYATVEVPQIVQEDHIVTVEVTRVLRETVVVTPFPPGPMTIVVSQGVDLTLPRTMHTTTRLNDDRILLVGGSNGVDEMYALVEIFDPATGAFQTAAPLNQARHDHTATLLQDNRVLVVGGYNPQQSPMSDAEVYDPWTNTWTTIPPLYAHGVQHTATRLADGRVLVVGGCSAGCTGQAEIFDPQTNSWTIAAPVGPTAASHTAILLEDGRVLAAGGTLADSGALLYDPQANTWTPTGQMASQHAQGAAIQLLDGRVLVAGGINISDTPQVLTSSEIYDPATNTWTIAADLAQPRFAHLLALLPDGQVAAIGGASVYEFSDVPYTADTFAQQIELYDPQADRWNRAAELPLPVTYAEVALLPFGRLWVTGGGAGEDRARAWANTWVITPRYIQTGE